MQIVPHHQSLEQVFTGKAYYIDFYQRQYKWQAEPVKKLLDDIFYKFNIEHQRHKGNNENIKKVIDNYAWYYLNTYVTNKIDGKVYIVDGQQRLTTLLLIIVALHHLGKEESILADQVALDALSQYITSTNIDGTSFAINHEKEIDILQQIYDNQDAIKPTTITGKNMVENYKTIQNYLHKQVSDIELFSVFTQYFFKRVVLIELTAEQTDIPMLFEVINDRGVRLKPYEILKGKLLGQISKDNIDKYNSLWETQIDKIESDKGADIFFEYFLRSKYTDSRDTAEVVTKDNYHRKMFEISNISNKLPLDNESCVINFLENEFLYHTNLYAKILQYRNKNDVQPYVYYNGLNAMNTQFLLIMSACKTNDSLESKKITTVAFHVDRMHSLLRLFQAYNSNKFTDVVYDISKNLRDANTIDEIGGIFDKKILYILSERYDRDIKTMFQPNLFKSTGFAQLTPAFVHYFFARIEDFIARGIQKDMQSDFDQLMKSRKAKNNYQVEHILARNKENEKKFESEEDFDIERNRLGALLLLKGRDNASSNNERYSDKLKTYAGTLYWNQTLTQAFYKSNKDFEDFAKKYKLNFTACNEFGKNEVEARQKLLFEIIKIIWK